MIYIPQITPFSIEQIQAFAHRPYNFYGIDEVCLPREFPVNEQIIFQFQCDTTAPTVLMNTTELVPTNITPSGWDGEGNYVFEVSYTPTTVGTINFYIMEGGYFFESENIEIVDDCEHLLKFEYTNSESDYGLITGTTFTTYESGDFLNATPTNEIDSYKNDRGELKILRATPIEAYDLKMWYCSLATVNRMNMIFSCDTIIINGMQVQASEVPKASQVEHSNMFEVSVNISRVDSDYHQPTAAADGIVLIDDNSDNIISDNNNNMLML